MREDLKTIDHVRYQELLLKLKKNRENVPLEILNTKYHTSYRKLKEELKGMTDQIIQTTVLDGLNIPKAGAEAAFCAINRRIRDSGLLVEISHAVFREQNLDRIMKLVNELKNTVHSEAYIWSRAFERKEDEDGAGDR